MKKCPGQDLGRKRPDEVLSSVECPSCGYDIEFFFDDISRTCPKCSIRVHKDQKRLLNDFGCAIWCDSAEECLGTKAYSSLKRSGKK
jgi:transposase